MCEIYLQLSNVPTWREFNGPISGWLTRYQTLSIDVFIHLNFFIADEDVTTPASRWFKIKPCNV
jgi:hypothetical protein